jgi:hypothetical protein
MTLAELVHAHEQRQARPQARPAACGSLTDKGIATVAVIRLRRQLAALDADARREIIVALTDTLTPVA